MAGYILDLRKIVGHRPLIQTGASVLVEDSEGRVLLQLRHDNHCWGYPGGSMEIDEELEDTARRELFEETGIIAEELELFGVFSGKALPIVERFISRLPAEVTDAGVVTGPLTLRADADVRISKTEAYWCIDFVLKEGQTRFTLHVQA